VEELRSGPFNLGGEQSGHIVLPTLSTTGDGILTGLRLMSRVAQTGESLASLASAMHTLPQVLINVGVADKVAAVAAPSVRDAVQQAEDELGDTGRILLRPSGTEQMIRVMVEADDEHVAHRLAAHVAETVRATH
jgi:phosphoglucosamine mutase